MTLDELLRELLDASRAKVAEGRAGLERAIADFPDEAREDALAQYDAHSAALLARLDREWAAFAHLYGTGQLPEDGAWRELIDLAATPRGDGALY